MTTHFGIVIHLKNKSNTIICLKDNKVIGFLLYCKYNNHYVFSEVGIKEEFRKNYGVLKMLYGKFIESNSKNLPIKCNINPKNEHSINVHTHIGFEKDNIDKYGYITSYEDFKKWINIKK